jgi:hypothetical protein
MAGEMRGHLVVGDEAGVLPLHARVLVESHDEPVKLVRHDDGHRPPPVMGLADSAWGNQHSLPQAVSVMQSFGW